MASQADLVQLIKEKDATISRLQQLKVAIQRENAALQQLKVAIQRENAALRRETAAYDPAAVVRQWFDRASLRAFQGGYGHAFHYGTFESNGFSVDRSPHHWVIREEDYEQSLPTEEEKRACGLLGFKFTIAKTPQTEIWGN